MTESALSGVSPARVKTEGREEGFLLSPSAASADETPPGTAASPSAGAARTENLPPLWEQTPAEGMVTVCPQCGDGGFDAALIYCGDCKKNAIHHYCLETLPKTFNEHVVWFCEDCRPKLGEPDEESCSPLCEEDDLEITELVKCTKNLKSIPLERLVKKKKIEKWTREKKKRKKNELKSQMEKDKEGGQLAEKGMVFTSETEVEKTKNVRCSQVYEIRSSGNYDKAENIRMDMRASSGYIMRNTNEEAESTKASQSPRPDCPEPFGIDTYVYAQPIIDPIWRGSLKFNKQGINYFGKVVAHVSNLACSKVSEEAKLFPSLLCTDLHPGPKVWPKGFKNCVPGDHSIALYIFPDNQSEQEFFDSLVVEMVCNDLAMRAVVTNAELLVFTSTKLPLHLWRFQSKFYLWGVFRGKQAPPVSRVDVNMPVLENDPLKTVSWKTHSPGSPLSVSASDGSSSMY